MRSSIHLYNIYREYNINGKSGYNLSLEITVTDVKIFLSPSIKMILLVEGLISICEY